LAATTHHPLANHLPWAAFDSPHPRPGSSRCRSLVAFSCLVLSCLVLSCLVLSCSRVSCSRVSCSRAFLSISLRRTHVHPFLAHWRLRQPAGAGGSTACEWHARATSGTCGQLQRDRLLTVRHRRRRGHARQGLRGRRRQRRSRRHHHLWL